MESITGEVRRLLQENADEETRNSSQRFFKESVAVYGVKSAGVRKIAKQMLALLKNKTKDDVFRLCEGLWRSGYLEETGIACEWSYHLHESYLPADFKVFEGWLDAYVHNWAACDTLCNHTIGTFVEMYPEFIAELKTWSTAENRWKKRAAAVTLIIPARKGLFLPDIFDIAQTLLLDPDDLVQKGYGWMLKAASEAHPSEVFDFVFSRKDVMPRTAFRYSLEKMPREWREKAMKK